MPDVVTRPARKVAWRAFFIRHLTGAVVLAALLSLSPAGHGDEDEAGATLRLSGTLALDGGRFIALVEADDGTKRIVRVGDSLAGGTVTAIRGEEAYIRRGEETLALTLDGVDTLRTAAQERNERLIASISVDAGQVRAVRALSGADEGHLTREFLTQLALPEDLRVTGVRVGSERYGSLTRAMDAIGRSLLQGDMAHLFFEAGGAIDEIYLMPPQS